MTMKMGLNRSLCRVNKGFELIGFASAGFFCDKKAMHNFSNESKNSQLQRENSGHIFSSKRKIMNFTISIYFS